MKWKWFGRKQSWPNRNYPGIFLEVLSKREDGSVIMASFMIETRTRHLTNTSLEHYYYSVCTLWKVNSRLASPKVPGLVWNLRAEFLNAQYSITDICPEDAGHNQETHTLFKIRFNIRYITPSMFRSPKRYFCLNFSNQMFGHSGVRRPFGARGKYIQWQSLTEIMTFQKITIIYWVSFIWLNNYKVLDGKK
jgi:hypothetical protein